MVADCAACGIVPIRKKGKSWRCYYGHQYGNTARPKTIKPMSDRCEICGTESKIFFDHSHATGAHRGWICHDCNLVLGWAKDNPETLKKAAAYLLQ
jgi:Recombination endonuclease VII.